MLQTIATPGSLPEAHAVLSGQAGARLIAGGTAVMPILNQGTDDFTSLVSLRSAGLSGISVKDGTATIGAATTLSELEDAPALAFLQAGARHDRFADHPQHGDSRRQSFRQAALWRSWPPA